MINIYQPSLGKEELKAVESVFKSNWLGKGPKTKEFIEQFAKKLTTEGAIVDSMGVGFETASPDNLLTISSCTEGLFQSVDLYVKEGDEVILPSVSFIGGANAISAKKAIPIFCDVNPRTLNPSVEDIEKCITKKTTAIIVIHYAGVPCDIERITELCSQRNIKLIEDNANSPFSRVNVKSTGTFGDVGIWSFDSMKQLVCGDGGMLYCKDKKDARRFDKLTYLGLESKSGFSNSVDKKWWEFDISSPSRRSITNDIQAAIGIVQLKKMDEQISIRSKIHNTYNKELGNLEWLDVPEKIPSHINSSYYMYHIQTKHRDELAKYLRDNGVYTTFRYYPLHWVEYYKLGIKLPNTDYAANNTLCIPLHQSLTDNDIDKIITLIKSFKK
jgi:dTDP-4-amino-4,6-dideoxygalactose transaminase